MNMELGSHFELDLEQLEQKDDSICHYLQHYNTVYVESGRSANGLLDFCIGRTIFNQTAYQRLVELRKKDMHLEHEEGSYLIEYRA